MEITPSEGLTADQRAELVDMLAGAELRPALLNHMAPESQRSLRKRFNHYSAWCEANAIQGGAEFITADTVLAYVRGQLVADELRPSTLHQALWALAIVGEKVTGHAPDVRQARELIRAYVQQAGEPEPAYRVGHQVHRPYHRTQGGRAGTA